MISRISICYSDKTELVSTPETFVAVTQRLHSDFSSIERVLLQCGESKEPLIAVAHNGDYVLGGAISLSSQEMVEIVSRARN